MNKREISLLKEAFDIPEPLHKKQFAAQFRELEKNQKRSFISPLFMKLASTAVLCALIIGVWTNMDDSVKPDLDNTGSVNSSIIVETSEEEESCEDECDDDIVTTITTQNENSEKSVSTGKTTKTGKKDKTETTTITSASKTTSESGSGSQPGTTAASSSKAEAESEKTSSSTSAGDKTTEKNETVTKKNESSSMDRPDQKSSESKTTEKTTTKATTTKATTTKDTTTKATTTKATTTKATTTKATTTKATTTKGTTTINNAPVQAIDTTTAAKSEQPIIPYPADNGSTGGGGMWANEPPSSRDLTLNIGTRIYPNGNYIDKSELMGNGSIPDYTGTGNQWHSNSNNLRALRYSDAAVIGTVEDIIYTVIDDTYYVQVNIEIEESVRGVLYPGDKISVFYEGGYMYATDFVRRMGIDATVSEGLMVDLSNESTYNPEIGSTYVFFLIDAYRYIASDAYMLSDSGDKSIFRKNGLNFYDKNNSYAFYIDDLYNY